MGYVRLVRSGGLRCSSNTVRFLPDLSRLPKFEALCTRSSDTPSSSSDDDRSHTDEHVTNVSEQTLQAARNLDIVIQNLQQAFHKDTDYFKVNLLLVLGWILKLLIRIWQHSLIVGRYKNSKG